LQPTQDKPTKRLKVALETSVMVAWSVHIPSKTFEVMPAQDEHYDRAQQLVGEIRSKVARRIGIVTRTILIESRNALRDALRRTLVRAGSMPDDPSDFSIILNYCGDRLERAAEILSLEPVDQNRKDYFFTQTTGMYSMLLGRASLVTERTTRALAEDRTRVTASPKYWGIKSELETKEVRQEMRQLYNLRSNPPKPRDMEILAEMAALYESYNQEMPTDVYLASTDHSHLSPWRFELGVVSDQITKQIEETLHVICEWPEIIAELIRKLGN